MSTAKSSTNLVQISNIINSTNDNQPNFNQNQNYLDFNNVATVTIGNNNISSPSNNQ